VTPDELTRIYRGYIDCPNRQDWQQLEAYVHKDVSRNGERLGLDGYRHMLESDFAAIPDLWFNIHAIVSEPPDIAARLHFDCRPRAKLFGIPVDGRRIQFDENVFYRFIDNHIHEVWSIIDAAAIAAQLENKNAGR
jgi:predicted ester cyclase